MGSESRMTRIGANGANGKGRVNRESAKVRRRETGRYLLSVFLEFRASVIAFLPAAAG